jgi:hypothetical protein
MTAPLCRGCGSALPELREWHCGPACRDIAVDRVIAESMAAKPPRASRCEQCDCIMPPRSKTRFCSPLCRKAHRIDQKALA